ncbi:MAG: hypothetical protein P4M10_04605, partial [Verrucomicrobiae bacterium]|nr:hypothetical protein [Verrucomicrobiae bacterium]
LHPGAQKGDATNLGTLSEPRRKQNLYANPKRTAKFSFPHFRRNEPKKGSKNLKKVAIPALTSHAASLTSQLLHHILLTI